MNPSANFKINLILFFSVSVFFILSSLSSAAQNVEERSNITLEHGAHRIGKRTDAYMERWRDYGLGQFIHWGVYSILGGTYQDKNYSDAGGAAEWIRSWKELPNEVYDSLYNQFDPENFKPKEWAAMAKQMGVKYLTFTTKHHDGFCLWPSAYTDYDIIKAPYKKDIVKAVVDAYNEVGIDVYLYFSVMDWNHPDWRYDLKTKEDSIAFDRFKLFTKNQLSELLTRYPTTKGLWFDGTWDNSWKKSGAFSDSLEQHLKSLVPGLIIGSRLKADDYGNRHFDANGNLMGDYEQGWERKIPDTYADIHRNDWDCVMTIPQNGWGYAEKWLGHWKTTNELIEMLAKCVSLDGNFVINFGPKGDGTFRDKEIVNAREVGDWMKVNGEAIYDCGYADWQKQDWGYYTKQDNGNKVYMIVCNIPVSHSLTVEPGRNLSIEKAYLMSAPQQPLIKENLDGRATSIHLPETFKPGQPFVIVLETKAGGNGKIVDRAKT